MLELSFLKTNKEGAIQGLKKRNYSEEELQVVDRILEVDEARRAAQSTASISAGSTPCPARPTRW